MYQIKLDHINRTGSFGSTKMHRKVRKCKFQFKSLLVYSLMLFMITCGQCRGDELVNQNSNQFSSHNNSYYFEVEENTIENQFVGQIGLTDGFTYRFGQLTPEFRLDSSNGRIFTTASQLDRERQPFYNLIVLSSSPAANAIQVKIQVLDQNDNSPFWLNNLKREITFSESAPIGSKHILDTAIDLDKDDELHYELVYCSNDGEQCSCDHQHVNIDKSDDKDQTIDNKSDKNSVNNVLNVNRPFKINFNNRNSILNLELDKRLDRELISNYNCKLCAFDLKNQSSSIRLHVVVLDDNDNSPVLDRSNYSTNLNRNLKKDDLILSVHATDPDEPNSLNSKISYSLQNENDLLSSNRDNILKDFYINESTGAIHIAHDGLPNHCSSSSIDTNQYNGLRACVFTVIATDHGNPRQQSKSLVTVYLSSNDNLHEPEIKILYFNQRFLQYAIVDKNALFGTALAAVSVFDPDNESVQPRLEVVSGNELDHFYLDSEFSNTGSYVIRVNQNFTNTSNPIGNYNLTLKATDFGQPALTSTQNLIIKTNEITKDHRPVFNQQVYEVEILETAPIGSFVCLVKAVDYDPQSVVYFYSLSGNNSDALKKDVQAQDSDLGKYFHIDSQTGAVTLARELDREQIGEFELKVFVRDTHLNSDWSSARINVLVLDINDNHPKVIRKAKSKPNFEVLEKDDLTILKIVEGRKVNFDFTVDDEDFESNGSVTVELLYDYQGLFHLNTTNYLNRKEKVVHLHSTKELDYETAKHFSLLFILSDQGRPKLSSQFKIEIEVEDLDDQPTSIYPKHYFLNLDRSNYERNLDKNLIKIKTVDADRTSMLKFFFNFNHNHKNLNFVNSLVTIDENAGTFQLRPSIKLDAFPAYLPFNVTCDRCDRSNQQATIHFYLNNQDQTSFSERVTSIVLSELSELKPVLNLSRLFGLDDLDTYQLLIVDGDAEQTFSVLNEQLMLIRKLDYEKISEYDLTVCAYNSQKFRCENLLIKIKNENTKQPQFEVPFIYLEILRDTPYHQNIYTLNAIDPDDYQFNQTIKTDQLTDQVSEIGSNIVYHFINNQQLNTPTIQNGNYMFRINKNQLELNVNLFERKFIKNELVYQYKEELIYLISIQARDLNLKKDDLQALNGRTINIFIKIVEPVLDKSVLFMRTFEPLRSFYELNIEESKPINSKLIKFDLIYHRELDGLLTFDFVNDDNNQAKNQFALFPDGSLYLKNRLDREQTENYMLQIAINLKQQQLKSNKIITVLIHVLDVNDNAPEFEQDAYHFYLPENSPLNTSIGKVKALDKDKELNSLVHYHLLSSKFADYVELNALTGQLYLKSPVDYETIKSIAIEIEAEDQAIFERRLKSKTKCVIHILNENDCAPCFEVFDTDTSNYLCFNKLRQQISIMENLKPNATIHEFKVKDQDTSADKFKFSILESEFSSSFSLNSSTGRLKLIKNLDREINERIELLIKVEDDGKHRAFNHLTIKLEDVNDNLPIFNKNNQSFIYHVNESTEPGTSILTLNATDYDSGLNGKVHYEIMNVESVKSPNADLCLDQPKFCEESKCFRIDKNQLILTNYLDYEHEKEYEINITAVDYYGLRSEILTVKVVVVNLNDCRPKFRRATADLQINDETISIFENIKVPTNILQVSALDCDENDELTYELIKCQILGTYHKRCPLELDAKTGTLVNIDNLDYEEIKRINLKLKVTDLKSHTDLKDLSIVILNVNDNKPKLPTTSSFVVLRQQAIEKNEKLAQLQAIDQDHDRITYKISESNDQVESSLYLDENDGYMYSKDVIDKNLELKFSVNLIDEGGLYTGEQVSLIILFTNSSLDTLDLVFDIYENEQIGLLIHKFKCDSFTCTYHLNTCNKLFSIESSGELRIAGNLDRELKSAYYFDVFVIDQQSNIKVYKVKINVLDRNDNSLKLVGNSLERLIRVKENERPKTIFDLSTIVTDFDLNTRFQFALVNCTASFNKTKRLLDQSPFTIEQSTGKIILNQELDREREEKYELLFSVSDGQFKISDYITILVTDLNDNVPTFNADSYSFNVSESTPNMTIIGSVLANDLDLDSILRYKIISEQENSPFKVNEKTGLIHLTKSINYQTDNHLFISVLQASDGEFVSKPANLYFNILKENKNAPLFERIEYRFVFNDSESISSELFCLKATDRDNDKLIYRLHENDEKEYQSFNGDLEEFYFEVNSESGCVKLLKQFNVNEKDWFQFVVNVSDGQYHDYARVYVQIIKSESSKLKHYKKTLLIRLNEGMRIGETICKFNDNVQLVNNSISLPFKINLFNELILKNKIDKLESYEFQLEFNDSIQNVTVNVQPNQINQPIKFERNVFERSIYEDHKLSKSILELHFDTDLNEKLMLEIINGNLNDQFLIHRNQLLLRKQLDYEQIKKFSLKVKASLLEQHDDLAAYATIQINVLNLIDQRPVFLNTPYLFKWCENQVGELGRFYAKSEYDLQSNGTTSTNNLKYLLKNNDFDYFHLDTNTGTLSVIKEIDSESLRSPVIELSVLVIDELNASLQNEIQATVEIVNLNDNKPVWPKSGYEISLNEQVVYAKGFVLAELKAYDLDNDAIEYKLIDCRSTKSATTKLDQCLKLSVNRTTGELYANDELIIDREMESEFNLIVEANDGEFRSRTKVNIKIKDENDFKPKLNHIQLRSSLVGKEMIKDDEIKLTIPYQYFTSDSYMTENDQLFLFGLSVLDLDEWNSANSKINFKLINSVDSRKLKLNKENGVLAIQNSLVSSFGDKRNRSVKVSAIIQDCGLKNSLESKIRLDIDFYDLNQLKWMTIFEPIINELQVSENSQPESTIHEFKLINQNLTNKISLNIVGGDYDNRFKIIEDTKVFRLILNRPLDYEYVQSYLIYLEATLIDSLTNKINFQLLELNLKLVNENDNEPRFSKSVYNVTIFEEQEPNQFVIQLEATDLDNNQYAKNTNDLTISNLDDDDFNVHEMNLERSSNDKQTSDFRFELLTTNVPFRIDQYSGVIFTTEQIDREKTGDLIQLQVEVQDDGGLKSQATVNVFVTDLNDNPPRYNQLFRVNVSESTPVDSFIIQITISDRDKPANNTHKFSLNDSRFRIDEFSGKVYLASKLDCDLDEDEIQMIVTVNDGEWNQDTTLTVHITDENDQYPEFRNCEEHFRLDESDECIYHFDLNNDNKDEELTKAVGRITAIDLDKGLNALISYQFAEESSLFKIDKQTGELFKLQTYLNIEIKLPIYEYKIQACDNGLLPKCSYAKIYLTRNSKSNAIKLPVPLDLTNGTVVYAKTALNRSEKGFGYCKSLSDDNAYDVLDYRNESLIFVGENRIRLGQQYQCLFWSMFESQQFTNLKIIVTNRNLFEPQLLNTYNQLILNETRFYDEFKSKQVFQFKATDNDSNDGFNNEITYSLKLTSLEFNSNALQYYFHQFRSNLEDEHFFTRSIEWLVSTNNQTVKYLNPFSIHPRTGALYLEHKLDFELIKSYRYQIKIQDNALFNRKSFEQPFDIHVQNLDDNKPLFVSEHGLTSQLNFSIKEHNQIDHVLGNLIVDDLDDPNCSIKNFKLFNSVDHFELDSHSNLKVLKSLNYENASDYTIYLQDINSKSLSNLKIKITVLNVHRPKPKFAKKLFEFNLLEQSKLSTVIANLNHTIVDNQTVDQIEFQLLKAIDFGIDLNDNNDLVVSDNVDFESFSMNEIYKQTQNDNVSISVIKLKFTLLVKLKDELVSSSDDYDRTELVINLIDLNEPPKFERSSIDCLLVRTRGQCNYQFVNECKVKCVDQDENDFVRFRLLNHDHLFSIDEHKGTINLISCNLTSSYLNLPPDNALEVVALDSNDLQSKIKVNIKMNWRSRVVDPLFNSLPSLNDHLYGGGSGSNSSANIIDKDLANEWCLKGKQVPETTDRMICYRKTVDHYCCKCRKNYQGIGHCQNEDLCSLEANYCENGGLCKQVNLNERICLCRTGFRGERCQQALNYCTDKSSKCGVNGRCELMKPYNTPKCNCLDPHTFGRQCNTFSLGFKPNSYIRLNVSLNEVNDELSMTFASYYKTNSNSQLTKTSVDDFGQLMFYNHGQPNEETGKQDFISLELYEKWILLRIGGSQLNKFIELKLNSNKQNLLDGRYYKFSLIRNRKVAHLRLYYCERMYLDNQLNCNNLLNQSSISYQQSTFHFDSNPLFIGGLDYAYSTNVFAQKTNGHVQAKNNFVGCLYKATMNGVKIQEFISEKSFVDPICRVSAIHQLSTTAVNNINSNNKHHQQIDTQSQSINNPGQDLPISQKKQQEDCNSYCGKESLYCKQNWFQDTCGCTIQISNQTTSNQDQMKQITNLVYESNSPCSNLCEVQMNRKSLIKLKLSDKWNLMMRSQIYQTKLEEFIIRFFMTSLPIVDSYSNLWTNGQMSVRISSNGSLYMWLEEDGYEAQMLKLDGKFKLNQWNTFMIKPTTGEQYVNDQYNRFESHLFKNKLKSMSIGGDLTGCISHIIINGRLLLNNSDHLYELHTENTNGFSCRSIFESSKFSLDTISIGIILIIMFFVILLLIISTSFMLFNSKRSKTSRTQTRRSTLPKIGSHFHQANKTSQHSLSHMIGNNSYSSSQDYYEEPFYYGDYFQHNEKLSNQFNLSHNRS